MQLTKKLRIFWWLLTGILSRYSKVILSAFIIGIFVFIFALKFIPFFTQRFQQGHKVIGLVGLYTPTNLPLSVQKLVSAGLTDMALDGSVIPTLATSWDVSEDGKVYTFHLQPDLYWHDKKNFTAADVNYNLRDVEFTASGDAALIVKLKDAFTPLPNFLSKPLFRKGLLGVGPYKIASIRLKGEYVSYIKLEPLTTELPAVEYKFYSSDTAAKTAFKLGEINQMQDISDPTPFTDWNTVSVVEEVKYNQYVGVFFNISDALLKEKEIRQGLAFAIEKAEKNRLLSPLSSKSWAYTTRVKAYDSDIPQAKKLVGDIASSSSGTLTLVTFQPYYSLAQRIASAWQGIGIKTEVKVESGVPDQYQAILVTQEIPSDPDQYTLWHSTQTQTNLSHYANPKIDKLLEDGRKESDPEKRKKIYFDFQRYLVEDAPAVFLFHPTTYTIIRK